jgi:hypothetical protein
MKHAKRTQFGDRGLHDCGLKGTGRDGVHAKRTQFGGRIVRNEPNFASSQAADREDCAKRSQTWGDWGMWTKVVGEWGVPGRGVKRAKRTQFGPAAGGRRRRNLRNEPNLAPAAGVSRSQNAQNEPNLARRDTGCPDRGVRCEVSSIESEKSGTPPPDFTLQTSNFTLPHGKSCKTRRPRQKSPSRAATSFLGRLSKIDSPDSDFCRVRQTNPICPAANVSQVVCGTGVTENLEEDGSEKTKPISPDGGI